jgi:L-aminopeptidase/D-esterase-like protein
MLPRPQETQRRAHSPRPGPRNLITDVAGLTVGHATDEAVRSGVTALLCPEGWIGAVDVRGGGPGIRESDRARVFEAR